MYTFNLCLKTKIIYKKPKSTYFDKLRWSFPVDWLIIY